MSPAAPLLVLGVALLDLVVAAVAAGFGLFMWTVFTFLAVDQGDHRVWTLAPGLAGGCAAVPVWVLVGLETALLTGLLVTAVTLVGGRLLLDDLETVRRSYLRDERAATREGAETDDQEEGSRER